MTSYQFLSASAFLLVSAACAPLAPRTGDVPAPASSRTLITQAEIRGVSAATALDAVYALRPAWLSRRAPQTVAAESDIVVYLDRSRLGGVRALAEIAAASVTSLEFLTPATANYRFGRGHPYGAILVSTRDR